MDSERVPGPSESSPADHAPRVAWRLGLSVRLAAKDGACWLVAAVLQPTTGLPAQISLSSAASMRRPVVVKIHFSLLEQIPLFGADQREAR